MDVDRVRAELVGTRFGDVRWVASTGSTNADVLALARDGAPEGIVVVADHQDAGRGRRGRSWQADPGAALMLTVLLRPPVPAASLATVAMAVAAAGAVAEAVGRAPGLKWPNDLVWPGDGSAPDRKLAGILAEADWPAGSQASGGWSRPGPGERVAVAVGIGLNVTWGSAKPAELADTAVSLAEIADEAPTAAEPAVPASREVLLVALLRGLDRTYRLVVGDDAARAELRAEWTARSATLGRTVRVDLGADDVVGRAVALSEDGHLVVETVEGERRTFAVGDVVHLR